MNALSYALEQYHELVSGSYICPTYLIFVAQLISTHLSAAPRINAMPKHTQLETIR